MSNNAKNTGVVKFFNEAKGFGFIIDNETKKEIFVHITGLKNKAEGLQENDEVTFDTQEGKKGLNAVNVELA
jgi:CspA family cold shock protein